jgi:hypothetical protein
MRLNELEQQPPPYFPDVDNVKNQKSTSSKEKEYKAKIKASKRKGGEFEFDNTNELHLWWWKNYTKQKNKAVTEGKAWNITAQYAWDLMNDQDWKCKLSGVDFSRGQARDWFQPSLDRINSNEGYIPGNVQYTTLAVNHAKKNMPENVFKKMCSDVAAISK